MSAHELHGVAMAALGAILLGIPLAGPYRGARKIQKLRHANDTRVDRSGMDDDQSPEVVGQ
jgi:hypothetical protein